MRPQAVLTISGGRLCSVQRTAARKGNKKQSPLQLCTCLIRGTMVYRTSVNLNQGALDLFR